MVGINEGIISTEAAPFGGIKHSGLDVKAGMKGSRNLETKNLCLVGLKRSERMCCEM